MTANFPQTNEVTARLGIVAPTPVDAFNAAMLTHRNFSVTADIDTYAGLQAAATAGDTDEVSELSTVTVAVRDQADSDGTNDAFNSVALTVEDADDGFDDAFTVTFMADDTALCVAEDKDDCDDANEGSKTELELVATGETSTLSNPFDRVDFWVQDVNGVSWAARVGYIRRERPQGWGHPRDCPRQDLDVLAGHDRGRPVHAYQGGSIPAGFPKRLAHGARIRRER